MLRSSSRKVRASYWKQTTRNRATSTTSSSSYVPFHKQQQQQNNAGGPNKPVISPIRQKEASQKLKRMLQVVQDLPNTPGLELKQALLYWLSFHVQGVARTRSMDPLLCAEQILHYVIDDDPKLAHLVLVIDNHSPSLQFRRLISLLTEPLKRNPRGMDRKRNHDDDKLDRLYRASLVWKGLERLQENGTFAKDYESYETLLSLWKRRIRYFTRLDYDASVMDWNDKKTNIALGGARNVSMCIDEMKRIVAEMNETSLGTKAASCYEILVTSLAHSGLAQAGDEIQKILQQLEAESSAELLSIELYNAALLAYSNRPSKSAVANALKVWSKIKERPDLPDTHWLTMSLILKLLVNAGKPEEAERVLGYMETRADETKSYPTSVHYNTVLTGWAKSNHPEAGEKAEALLHRMIHLASSKDGFRSARPDCISYALAIESLVKGYSPDGVERAEALLDASEQSEDTEVMPDTRTYVIFMSALVERQKREVERLVKESIVLKMEEILLRMHNMSKRHPKVRPPIADTYGLVLRSWTLSQSARGAGRVLAIFDDMLGKGVKPNEKTIKLVLKGLLMKQNESQSTSLAHANRIMQQMEEAGIQKSKDIHFHYQRILARADVDSLDTENAEDLPHSSDAISILTRIEGLGKHPDKVVEADRLLRHHLESLLSQDTTVAFRAVALVISSWTESGDPEFMDHADSLFRHVRSLVPPPSHVYGVYLTALRHSNRPDAPHRIEETIRIMQEESESGVNVAGKPNASQFATAISCWAQCDADRAEAILDRIEDLSQQSSDYHEFSPTVPCYRGAILAWSLSGHPNAGDRAIALLDRMERFERMPNRSCYKYAIKAVGKSNDARKAEKVLGLLKRMQQNGVTPSKTEYIDTIRAIGTTQRSFDDRTSDFRFAQEALQLYLDSTPLDKREESVLLQFLWTCFRLMKADPLRDELVKDVLANFPETVLHSDQTTTALGRVLSGDAIREVLRTKEGQTTVTRENSDSGN